MEKVLFRQTTPFLVLSHGGKLIFKLKEENLFVKTCYVDEGIVMKRAKMDSRGHVGRNDHKTSHITIVVSELNK